MLPPEVTLAGRQWVCCNARIVRVEEASEGKRGVAAAIEKIAVLPEL